MLVLLCPSDDSSEPSDGQVFNCIAVHLYICPSIQLKAMGIGWTAADLNLSGTRRWPSSGFDRLELPDAGDNRVLPASRFG
jgi:hypothetical protein